MVEFVKSIKYSKNNDMLRMNVPPKSILNMALELKPRKFCAKTLKLYEHKFKRFPFLHIHTFTLNKGTIVCSQLYCIPFHFLQEKPFISPYLIFMYIYICNFICSFLISSFPLWKHCYYIQQHTCIYAISYKHIAIGNIFEYLFFCSMLKFLCFSQMDMYKQGLMPISMSYTYCMLYAI